MTSRPGDEQIGAYLDGELSPEARREIEEAARSDPDVARRIARERALLDALRRAYDPVLDEHVPARLLNAAGPRPWSWTRRVAAGLACAVLGGALGWGAATRLEVTERLAATRPVTVEAAAAHAVYVPERRHAVEVASSERTHLDRWLSKRLAHDLAAPDLTGLGFELVGGRLLSDTGAPAAQYMYEDGAKNRVTLYVRREPGAATSTGLHLVEDRGFKVVHWQDDGLSYAVTGTLEGEQMMTLAATAHDQL